MFGTLLPFQGCRQKKTHQIVNGGSKNCCKKGAPHGHYVQLFNEIPNFTSSRAHHEYFEKLHLPTGQIGAFSPATLKIDSPQTQLNDQQAVCFNKSFHASQGEPTTELTKTLMGQLPPPLQQKLRQMYQIDLEMFDYL